MHFPIDVLLLDGENRMIRKVEHLLHWRLEGPVAGARSVVETRAGGFREVRVGDTTGVSTGYSEKIWFYNILVGMSKK